ncbi:MAG: energy transducer TonB [Chitinophagales bacterium]|nr:energy transducer TonB [Chitinophagales bacterium]
MKKLSFLFIVTLFYSLTTSAQSSSGLPVIDYSKTGFDSTAVFEIFNVEKIPVFPGGEAAMFQFISTNLVYPDSAQVNNVEGVVALSMVIEKDGSLSDIKVLKDIAYGCGEASIAMVKKMPKWMPGQIQGTRIRTRYVMPIRFKLK